MKLVNSIKDKAIKILNDILELEMAGVVRYACDTQNCALARISDSGISLAFAVYPVSE